VYGIAGLSHWEWSNYPKAFAGIHQNRHGKRSVVMETVCDEDLWIWHVFVGCPGSQNDLNIMHAPPLYLSVTGGEWPPRTFSYKANGTTRTLLYYLVDGIYPPFAFFVSPFPDITTEVETTFNRLQEALRKDVERLYAVLTARFHIALHPARHVTVESMVTVAKAVAILHNMVTEKRRNGYVSRTRMAAAAQAEAGGSGGGAEGFWNGAAETPAAAGGAAGVPASDGAGRGGGGGTGLIPDGGGPAAGVGAAGGGAGGGEGGGTGMLADGGGHAAGVGVAGGGAAGGGGGGTGFIPDGGGPAAGVGAAGGGAGSGGGGGMGMLADGGGHAAGVGAAGGGAAGGGGDGTGLTGGGGSHAAGGVAAGGSPQSNANSLGGSDGPPAGVAAPVIVPAGALPAGSFGHALNAWAEARDEEEHKHLRHDLAEHVWMERCTLPAPYV